MEMIAFSPTRRASSYLWRGSTCTWKFRSDRAIEYGYRSPAVVSSASTAMSQRNEPAGENACFARNSGQGDEAGSLRNADTFAVIERRKVDPTAGASEPWAHSCGERGSPSHRTHRNAFDRQRCRCGRPTLD